MSAREVPLSAPRHVGELRHFGFLGPDQDRELFHKPPQLFDRTAPREVLAEAMGATLYTPATFDGVAKKVARQAEEGLTSAVICLEDAIADDDVAAAEDNLVDELREAATWRHGGPTLPLLFVRVRTPGQLLALVDRLGDAITVLTGFVLPKFRPDIGMRFLAALDVATREARRRAADGQLFPSADDVRLYGMPILETPEVAHRETRLDFLREVQGILAGHRSSVLSVRFGGTDLCGVYGLRRPPDLTIYDVGVVRDAIIDIVDVFGRHDGWVVPGPVWEYFDRPERIWKPQLRQTLFEEHLDERQGRKLRVQLIDHHFDGLIREVELDQANGLTGKTVIHPTHVRLVNALHAVSHEEHQDAVEILGDPTSGAAASGYRNKMNEPKPHRRWAMRVMRRAGAFGVLAPDQSFVNLLDA
jgi:citrate lyase beta subunit